MNTDPIRIHASEVLAFGKRYVLIEDEHVIANDPASPRIDRGPFYRCENPDKPGVDETPGVIYMPDEYYLRGQLPIPGSMYAIQDSPSPLDKEMRMATAARIAALKTPPVVPTVEPVAVAPTVDDIPAPKPVLKNKVK